ncbi:pyruvate/2-oxoglutarate dehydrogenase complex dihydrolipoamide dehydrogenase (E3) component [Pseudonocardia sediminis]|uniref:Pyruvate/2-oxoglutarate dehydrogenase complex dihydrolipoamide dehydrogenase (E3) component n=1 Tax=Pseudonocardia sediminis TaxID=1397368 RepID=A0A4V2FQ89_PSEST|nr:FAD-dependent oxidoreductase [Pseudonocardia sediminis]RZT83850.1 pyruvate/2-oxoglutarate dehydrogenase complex dihydrolipoamide dehydrogenase (E3) component [Pseudonocardia sediminis]
MSRVPDLLVVGGGSAGLVGARTAASFGASVLLVEAARTGGDCLWTGCVPSKALLAAASAAADARAAARLGVHVDGVRIDLAAVRAHVDHARRTIEPVDSAESLAAAGVTVRRATARLTGPDTATVDGEPVRFRRALIATGSSPLLPGIPGLADADPLTTDTVWDALTELPDRLVVLGAGSVGCELAQALARLGVAVSLVEAAPRLLPGEDPDASRVLAAALRADGVEVHTGRAVSAVEGSGATARVLLDGGERLAAGRVLAAFGRRPDTAALDLASAGVALDEQGCVRVDEQLRTTNPRIWAAGDVTAHPRFTHVAGVHGSTAATNAVLGLRRRAETVVPRVTFTAPEVASVGAAPGAKGTTVQTRDHDEVDRAVTDGDTTGFARLVVDRRGRVAGAVVVGPRAGEVLAELTLAVRHGLRTRDLAGTMHPYPTHGDAPWNAAIADVRTQLGRGPVRAAVRLVMRGRRLWVSRRR